MTSQGAELHCKACGKTWRWEETGQLRALEGETEFDHLPDWFRWPRPQVRQQLETGVYAFTDQVDVWSMPGCWKFFHLGQAQLTHDTEHGLILEGVYRGKPCRIQRSPLAMPGLHVEYGFRHLKPLDCFDLSTEDDSFYCYPTKENISTKLQLAVEELHKLKLAEKRKR